MYAIYGNIYHQYTPNVSIYASTMDPMGTKYATTLESNGLLGHGQLAPSQVRAKRKQTKAFHCARSPEVFGESWHVWAPSG